MTFDTEDHKQIVAELVNRASFPGHLLEQAIELKKAVAEGEVAGKATPKLSGKRAR